MRALVASRWFTTLKILMILKMFSSEFGMPSLKLTCMFHLMTGASQKWSSIWIYMIVSMIVYHNIPYAHHHVDMHQMHPAWNFGPNSSPTAAGPGEPRPKKAALWVFNLPVENGTFFGDGLPPKKMRASNITWCKKRETDETAHPQRGQRCISIFDPFL